MGSTHIHGSELSTEAAVFKPFPDRGPKSARAARPARASCRTTSPPDMEARSRPSAAQIGLSAPHAARLVQEPDCLTSSSTRCAVTKWVSRG
jgi:hypothetical protein